MAQRAISESSRTRRGCLETDEPVNNWLQPKFGNLHSLRLSRDLQQFLFFVNHGYAHISLLCFSLVMLSASHWLLTQALFCGRTQLWAWWHFGNHLVDIILERIWSCQHSLIHSTCGHDDISVITPVLSLFCGSIKDAVSLKPETET